MTPDQMGLSFAPTGQRDMNKQNGSQTPIQDAIKVLSLRMPFNAGSGGITPLAGMDGGSAGIPNAGMIPGGLEELFRRLFGQMGGQQGGPAMPGSAPPLAPPSPVVSFPEARMQPGPSPSIPQMPNEPRMADPGQGPQRPPIFGGRPPMIPTR